MKAWTANCHWNNLKSDIHAKCHIGTNYFEIVLKFIGFCKNSPVFSLDYKQQHFACLDSDSITATDSPLFQLFYSEVTFLYEMAVWWRALILAETLSVGAMTSNLTLVYSTERFIDEGVTVRAGELLKHCSVLSCVVLLAWCMFVNVILSPFANNDAAHYAKTLQ